MHFSSFVGVAAAAAAVAAHCYIYDFMIVLNKIDICDKLLMYR